MAFAIFVSTGLRFAILAWEYGDWMDKPLSILAGLIIGITVTVTLPRVWTVPPRQTVESRARTQTIEPPILRPNASEIYAAARRLAARNREIARGAAALGSTRGWPFRR
ncbi:MAG: hypothetical protein ACLPWF_10425 [Bryobacteraceae bacterium]